MFFVRINNQIKKRKRGFLNTPIAVAVVETHWGIAGLISQRTVVTACSKNVALLLLM